MSAPAQILTPGEVLKNRKRRLEKEAGLVFDATPEERLLLAIFGLHPGETVVEALQDLRSGGRT